jgi:hypothetical protein
LSVDGAPHRYRYSVEFDTAAASFAVRNCKDRRYVTYLTVYDQNELRRCGTIYDQEESV